MVIKPNGNIGVNTNDPQETLHVVGSAAFEGNVAFSGNVVIRTASPQAKLDVNGKINCTVLELTSDRNQKAGFGSVDRREVLRKVARLPLTTWHHTNAPGVRHLGPMAQDFHVAFHLGSDDRHIATVDADGVLFASVQALIDELQDAKSGLAAKDAEIALLKSELTSLKLDLVTRLAAMEKMMAQQSSAKADVASAKAGDVRPY